MFLQFPKVASSSWPRGHHFQHDLYQADIPESSILITEPYFNLPQIQRIYDQFVFEEYEFKSYYRCTRPCISVPRKTPRTYVFVYSCFIDPSWVTVHRTPQNPRWRSTSVPRLHVGRRLWLQLHPHRPSDIGVDRMECCEKVNLLYLD